MRKLFLIIAFTQIALIIVHIFNPIHWALLHAPLYLFVLLMAILFVISWAITADQGFEQIKKQRLENYLNRQKEEQNEQQP